MRQDCLDILHKKERGEGSRKGGKGPHRQLDTQRDKVAREVQVTGFEEKEGGAEGGDPSAPFVRLLVDILICNDVDFTIEKVFSEHGEEEKLRPRDRVRDQFRLGHTCTKREKESQGFTTRGRRGKKSQKVCDWRR